MSRRSERSVLGSTAFSVLLRTPSSCPGGDVCYFTGVTTMETTIIRYAILQFVAMYLNLIVKSCSFGTILPLLETTIRGPHL